MTKAMLTLFTIFAGFIGLVVYDHSKLTCHEQVDVSIVGEWNVYSQCHTRAGFYASSNYLRPATTLELREYLAIR